MTDELEINIENRIVKYVESIGGLALKLVLASAMGIPDRTLLLPGGLVIFIEIKRPSKSKTYFMQRKWQERLQRRGFRCEFVASLEDVRAIIADEKVNVERWRDVVGCEGLYEVSSTGRVQGRDRHRSNGFAQRGVVLSQRQNPYGYMLVNMRKDGKQITKLVHRLVLEAFVGICPPDLETRHLDGCRTNNEITNLCWGTSTENNEDQARHGTQYVRKVRRSDGVIFENVVKAAKASGTHDSGIRRCCSGRGKTSGGYGWEYVE